MEDLFERIHDDIFYCSVDWKTDIFYLPLEISTEFANLKPLLQKLKANGSKLKSKRKQLRRIYKPPKLHHKCFKKLDPNYQRRRHVHNKIHDVDTLVCERDELSYTIDIRVEILLDLMVKYSMEPVLQVNDKEDYSLIRVMRDICGFEGYLLVDPELKGIVRRIRKDRFKFAHPEECARRIENEKLFLPLEDKTDLIYLQMEMNLVLQYEIMPLIPEFTMIERMLKPVLRLATIPGFRFQKRVKVQVLKKHFSASMYKKKWWTYQYLKARLEKLKEEHYDLMTEFNYKLEKLYNLMINASKHPFVFVRDKFEYFSICVMKEICGFDGYVWIRSDLDDLIEHSRKANWKLIDEEYEVCVQTHKYGHLVPLFIMKGMAFMNWRIEPPSLEERSRNMRKDRQKRKKVEEKRKGRGRDM